MASVANPVQLTLTYSIPTSGLADAHRQLRAMLDAPLPAVTGVISPVSSRPSDGKRPASPVLGTLLANFSGIAKPESFTLKFSKTTGVWFQHNADTFDGVVRLSPADGSFAKPSAALAAMISVVRNTLRVAPAATLELVREGDGEAETCVPIVPLADRRAPIVITTDAEIAEHYADPKAFLDAGWDNVERIGERLLLMRCQRAETRGEILAATQAGQWAMARAAKPGAVYYDDPVVLDEERAVFERGSPRLELVGEDATGLVELSCVLERGDHLRPADVFRVRKLVADGKQVRVVFMEKWMAEAERRPLLDVGARVFCMVGEADVEITE